MLEINIENNSRFTIEPMQAALSEKVEDLVVHTRAPRTMAHSLTGFKQLKVANTSPLAGGKPEVETETIRTSLLDDYTLDIDRLRAVHISVNGHEPEVVMGGIETARKADIIQVSCPYSRNGRRVRDIVVDHFNANGIQVFSISGGAAVCAGRTLGEYMVLPLHGPTLAQRVIGKGSALLRAAIRRLAPWGS